MAAGVQTLSSWISQQVGVDDAIAEYVAGILDDDSPEEEKSETITGIIAEAIGADSLPDGFMASLFAKHKEDLDWKRIDEETERLQRLSLAKQKEQETLAAGATAVGEEAGAKPKKILTREEQKERDRLLAKYGFATPEVVEGADGEEVILYGTEDADKGGGSADGLVANRNADIVKSAEAEKRRLQSMAHSKQIEKEKELQRKRELAKEKEKRRTQKQEKRRM
ncbi:hypothetical protein M427DRAFT_138233 [Gonapodya prolifera JEL478]|uniref:CCDC43 PWI-like domain-containing protein n=1 Tax=Gonapodya prolifera (strain JEL478) TaxID=1344416 RepID=A0A139A4Y5_GONPJ|nr:hypothetical protein M427DRAFT_138233 [Gonapodya prolifera JEL478]|eukprot:KXS11453.1 hypothetical protein M427DRAFT_138233 [Gonapodya prolifera JEL478]